MRKTVLAYRIFNWEIGCKSAVKVRDISATVWKLIVRDLSKCIGIMNSDWYKTDLDAIKEEINKNLYSSSDEYKDETDSDAIEEEIDKAIELAYKSYSSSEEYKEELEIELSDSEEDEGLDDIKSAIVTETYITGYHAYKIKAPPGKELEVLKDPTNKYDKNGTAFKVLIDGQLMGHVPACINPIFHKIVTEIENVKITCYATDPPTGKYPGKGAVTPCYYKF